MKKYLSLILAFALAIALPVTAAESDGGYEADYKTVLAYELLVALGITDAEYTPDPSVNISHEVFAESLANLIGVDAGSVTQERYFKDVEKNSVINDLTALQIIPQTENFNPEKEITSTDAVIMTLNALGYGTYAKALGGTDYKYMQIAADIGLTGRRTTAGNLTAEGMIVLLNNALNCGRYAVNGITDSVSFREEEPLITEKYETYKYEGRVMANRYVSLTEGENPTKKGYLKVADTVFECAVPNAEDYIGQSVILYYHEEDGRYKILCMVSDEDKSGTVEFTSKDVESVEDGKIVYGDGKKIKLNNPLVVYNGKAMFDISAEKKREIFCGENTFFRFLKQDDNYEIAVAEHYDDCRINGVDVHDEKIYCTSVSSGTSYALSCGDDAYVTICTADGEKIEDISELARGDFVSCAANNDIGYVRLIKCTETISGKIEKTKEEGCKSQITIGGVDYDATSTFAEKTSVGESGTFRLNAFGCIADKKDVLNDSEFMFGYVYKRGMVNAMQDSVEYKIFTEKNEHKVYKLAQKVKIDSEKAVSFTEADKKLAPSGKLERRLIRFKLNPAGEISCIDTAEKGGDESENSLTEVAPKGVRKTYVSSYYKKYNVWGNTDDIKAGNYMWPMSTATVMFGIPQMTETEDPEEAEFNLYTNIYNSTGNEVDTTLTLYKVGNDTPFINAAVFDDYANVTSNIYKKQTWLVNEVSLETDANGNPTTKLQMLNTSTSGAGATTEIYFNDTVKIKIKDTTVETTGDNVGSYISSGDIVQYKTLTNGLVQDIALTYDYSEGEKGIYWSEDYSYESRAFTDSTEESFRFVFANVYEAFAPVGNPCIYMSDITTGELREACLIPSSVPMYDSSRRGAKAYMGTVYYINDGKNVSGEETTKVLVWYKDASNMEGVVFYK